jgi:riboflavin biosynthesis pyrimidine reductase
VALTKRVSDAHLAGLRADGVSYIFAGDDTLDLPLLLNELSRELGIDRLLLQGGGTTNAIFLREGLVDAISLLVFPAIDGTTRAPTIFGDAKEQPSLPGRISLERSEILDGGVVWLSYTIDRSTTR